MHKGSGWWVQGFDAAHHRIEALRVLKWAVLSVLHAIWAAPWRRGAPKAQDRCASKRHPSTQRSVWQLCKARLRIVISSEARNLCHSRPSCQWLEFPNGKPAIYLPSGIAPYILQRSCHHNPEPWTLNPEPWTLNPLPFLKTLHEKPLDTAASNWYNNTRLSQEPVKRSPKERRKTSWQTKANVILSHKSHDRAANTDRSKSQMKTRPWKRF